MQVRELNAKEFPILCGMDDGFTPDPGSSIAVVAFDGKEPVGRVFLLAPTHLEGPWIREDKRNATLAFRLVAEAEKAAADRGVRKMFAYAVNDEIADYLQRLGYQKWDVTVWTKEL